MIRTAIVEDEYYVRKGMIRTIDWNALDCELVGEASNGREGLELIRSQNPDLVITDIKMPFMDGIEMARELKRYQCSAEFIFLTAYSEFSFAHNALKLEAVDYLLKPVDGIALKEAIEKAKYRINLKKDAPNEEETSLLKDTDPEIGNLYVRHALKYIKENYNKDISLASAAEFLEISEGYLSRVFKKETKYTFSNYLIQYRMQIAAGLLKNFKLKIYEVAAETGYSDTNYFSNLFKKTIGISPTDYQKGLRHPEP